MFKTMQTLYSSKDVTALSKQLYMMTTFNISADESVYIEYTNLLKNLSIHLVEHNITVSNALPRLQPI